MRKSSIKIGGILIAGLMIFNSIFFCKASSLVVANDGTITTASETETTSKKQETINEDILPVSKEVVYASDKKDIVYTTASLNVRKKPDADSKVVGKLKADSKIVRVKNNRKWDAIEVAGVKYYVNDKYLTKAKPETVRKVKKLEKVNKTKNKRYPITVKLTKKEKRDLAALVKLEGGGEPIECQRAIASVVINRMMYWDSSLHSIIYAKNQFTPASRVPYTTPSKTQMDIVEDICENGTTIPRKVLYFRAGYFFNWSTVVNYKKIGNTCFSSLK